MRALEAWANEFPSRRRACLETLSSFGTEEVTAVCVTKRPRNLENVIANYERQMYGRKRLLVVTNSREFDLDRVRDRIAQAEGARTFDVEEETTLGACLNLAMEKCETRFMAKLDDDDRYGTPYLSDMLMAHDLADAVVVGKLSWFAYIEALDRHVLRFPGWEFTYAPHVAGGTLVIDLSRVGEARFPDVTVGEDTGFVQACLRAGGSVFSADCFNYLQHRGSDNTWAPPASEFLSGSLAVRGALAGRLNLESISSED